MRQRLFNLAAFLGCGLCILGPMLANFPISGHDLVYFLPRMMDTYLFMRNEGFAVQWWTASFGGGLPVFANPQSMQFSLPQMLTFFLNPFHALCVSTVLLALFHGAVGWLIARRILAVRIALALCFSCALAVSGFTIAQTAAGHVTYHAFPLITLLLWMLTDPHLNHRQAVLGGAFCVAALVYAGGYFLPLLAIVSVGISLPLLIHCGRTSGVREGLRRFVASGLWGAFIALPKIIAVVSFISNFPRAIVSESLPSFFSPLKQLVLFPVWAFLKAMDLTGLGPTSFSFEFLNYRPFGIWETDTSVFIGMTVLASGFFVWLLIKNFGQGIRKNFKQGFDSGDRRAQLLIVWFLSGFFLVLSMASAQGFLYSLLKPLPLFRSLHVNCRFSAALIFPVCALGILGAQELLILFNRAWSQRIFLAALLGGIFIQAGAYTPFAMKHWPEFGLGYDVRDMIRLHRKVKESPEAYERVLWAAVDSDTKALLTNSTSLIPYEPAFGYEREVFNEGIKVIEGPVEGAGGFYNLTFAPSLMAPKFYDVPPFSLISKNDSNNFELFVTRRAPDWPLPPIQRVANILGVTALLVWLGIFVSEIVMRMRKTPRTVFRP